MLYNKEAEELQNIADNIQVSCIIMDKEYKVLYTNEKSLKYFGTENHNDILNDFIKFSPQFQSSNKNSKHEYQYHVDLAFKNGFDSFSWEHLDLNKKYLQSIVLMVKFISFGKEYIMISTSDYNLLHDNKQEHIDATERARMTYDNSPIGCIIFNEQGEILDCNKEILNLVKLNSVDEVKERFFELCPEHQKDGEKTRDIVSDLVEQAKGSELNGKYEWILCDSEKNIVHVEVDLVHIKNKNRNEIMAYMVDKKAINKLKDAEIKANERMRAIYNSLPLGCNFWNENIECSECNDESARIFGFDNAEDYIEGFQLTNPEYQPDGRLSSEKAPALVKQAFKEGKVTFEWMHKTLQGEPVPAEITLVRVQMEDEVNVIGYVKDLREIKATMLKAKVADDRMRLMLDSAPVSIDIWNEKLELIDCSKYAYTLLGIKEKSKYLKEYNNYLPLTQKDGQNSLEKRNNLLIRAFSGEKDLIEEMNLVNVNGVIIPTSITFVQTKYENENMVITYKRNLTREKQAEALRKEAEERMRLMIKATPLSSILWDNDFNIIDCNETTSKMFRLDDKKLLIKKYYNLSPEYQPDGRLSKEKMIELLRQVVNEGEIKLEWMHQDLHGELIPTELTLVCVYYENKYSVISYIRDLRTLDETVKRLDQLEKIAFTDALTEIYNRRYFMENAPFYLNDTESEFSILMFDIDHFKNVNDTYGHLAGDEVLKSITKVVQLKLRDSDMFARYGGEEFLILVNNVSDDVAIKLAERIRKAVEETSTIVEGQIINVTISIGIASKNNVKDLNINSIVIEADTALYKAKTSGRNRVEVANKTVD